MESRCFIENDFEIDKDEIDYMLKSIWRSTRIEGLDFNKMFPTIITNASGRKLDVWKSICDNEYIFIKTGFIGDSAILLEDMCEMALKKKVKNKVIVNFRDSERGLQLTERGLRMLQILQARNNVKYVSQDTEDFVSICKLLFL